MRRSGCFSPRSMKIRLGSSRSRVLAFKMASRVEGPNSCPTIGSCSAAAQQTGDATRDGMCRRVCASASVCRFTLLGRQCVCVCGFASEKLLVFRRAMLVGNIVGPKGTAQGSFTTQQRRPLSPAAENDAARSSAIHLVQYLSNRQC